MLRNRPSAWSEAAVTGSLGPCCSAMLLPLFKWHVARSVSRSLVLVSGALLVECGGKTNRDASRVHFF